MKTPIVLGLNSLVLDFHTDLLVVLFGISLREKGEKMDFFVLKITTDLGRIWKGFHGVKRGINCYAIRSYG